MENNRGRDVLKEYIAMIAVGELSLMFLDS